MKRAGNTNLEIQQLGHISIFGQVMTRNTSPWSVNYYPGHNNCQILTPLRWSCTVITDIFSQLKFRLWCTALSQGCNGTLDHRKTCDINFGINCDHHNSSASHMTNLSCLLWPDPIHCTLNTRYNIHMWHSSIFLANEFYIDPPGLSWGVRSKYIGKIS